MSHAPVPASARVGGAALVLIGGLDLALGLSLGFSEVLSLEGAVAAFVTLSGIALLLGKRWAWFLALLIAVGFLVLGIWMLLFFAADITTMGVPLFGIMLLLWSCPTLICLLIKPSRSWALG